MNVIITSSFLKKFRKDFKKYNFSVTDFAIQIKNTKIISLKKPFNKIKIKLNGVDFRGIVLINIENKILPVYLVLKKDKKYGNNLLVENEIEKIIKLILISINKDLDNGDYLEY